MAFGSLRATSEGLENGRKNLAALQRNLTGGLASHASAEKNHCRKIKKLIQELARTGSSPEKRPPDEDLWSQME